MSTRTKLVTLALGAAACLLVAGAERAGRAPRLVFNATASAPLGFYSVSPGRYQVGDLVAVSPPPELALWLARRRYLPANVPLLKVVVAAGGGHVCGKGDVLLLDGVRLARMRSADRWGRALIPYHGCRQLAADEVLLVNVDAPNSLDSRYFGPLPASGVIGRARPVWTWEGRS